MAEHIENAEIVVIGGGLSGVAYANQLAQNGRHCVVLDRGRHTGGRIASRSVQCGRETIDFDHGAPMLHLDQSIPELFVATSRWIEDGILVRLDEERYTCTEYMRLLMSSISSNLDIRQSTTVNRAWRDGRSWMIEAIRYGEDYAKILNAQHIVFACPLDQAIRVLEGTNTVLKESQGLTRFSCTWVVMLLIDCDGITTLELPAHRSVAHVDKDVISSFWIEKASDAAIKIVLHMNPSYAEARRDSPKEEIASVMMRHAQQVLPEWFSPHRVQATDIHRWGMARATQHLQQPFIHDPSQSLWVIGDQFSGTDGTWRDATAAIMSGVRAAQEFRAGQ